MKKLKYVLLILMPFLGVAQEKASVEPMVSNVQIGLGAFINSEFKMDRTLTLHAEVGALPSWTMNYGGVLAPTFGMGTRWYYNLDKRQEKGYNISNNAGNFLSLMLNYRPKGVLFSSKDNVQVIENISIVPKWAIRRNLGKNFHYEVGAGLGIRKEFKFKTEAELDLHLRIGYTF